MASRLEPGPASVVGPRLAHMMAPAGGLVRLLTERLRFPNTSPEQPPKSFAPVVSPTIKCSGCFLEYVTPILLRKSMSR